MKLLVVVNKTQIYLVNTRRGTHHIPTHITQSVKLRHHRNGQAKATNKVILKILKKMKHKYKEKWSSNLTDVLWACRSSLKTVTGFSPFSLIYGREAISLIELIIPTPRIVLKEIQEDTDRTHDNGRLADLEGLEKK